jgi:hypothetical protein
MHKAHNRSKKIPTTIANHLGARLFFVTKQSPPTQQRHNVSDSLMQENHDMVMGQLFVAPSWPWLPPKFQCCPLPGGNIMTIPARCFSIQSLICSLTRLGFEIRFLYPFLVPSTPGGMGYLKIKWGGTTSALPPQDNASILFLNYFVRWVIRGTLFIIWRKDAT